jgi:hypothetical protein
MYQKARPLCRAIVSAIEQKAAQTLEQRFSLQNNISMPIKNHLT